MAQPQTTTTATPTTNGNGKTRKERTPQPVTAASTIAKIEKLLAQLPPGDRKRVHAFFGIPNE
jgi:hypothetical protein